ncbi:MAG: hypothetical protein HC910_00550 [Spirulinaceae cyanobacterium SM2_1_0]|nr:hypothetical protein [Spirulinaceae cyanobacterium SM2_1_0]
MSCNQFPQSLPAPCIIETGTIINPDDIYRLLGQLGRVRYIHYLDNAVRNEGEGCVQEVFAEAHQSTLIANHALYLNIHSFDYLQLQQLPDGRTCFDLVQDNRLLRLIPLTDPLVTSEVSANLDDAALEAMLTHVLSAKWDVQLDDDYPF